VCHSDALASADCVENVIGGLWVTVISKEVGTGIDIAVNILSKA
jgi:hypothetical protein